MAACRLLGVPCVAVLAVFAVLLLPVRGDEDEDEDPYTTTDPRKREPSPCETCKFFATELTVRLAASAKSKEVIETGHGLDKKNRFLYKTSELRLTEAVHEPHICEKILEYNVHAERKGSLRYAKGQSETMSTLHGLVHKGVKVDLGIPYELWDTPSAEVSKMQRQCFILAERYEDDIEDWYYNLQDKVDFTRYLCADRYLKGRDQQCLGEVYVTKGVTEESDKKKKKKKKSKKGDAGQATEETHTPNAEQEKPDDQTRTEL